MPSGASVVPRCRCTWRTESWMGARPAVAASCSGTTTSTSAPASVPPQALQDFAADERVGDRRRGKVGAALEAVAGVGMDEVPARRGANAGGVEPRRLDEDVLRLRRDHGVVPAHHAGKRDGLRVVGDDEVVGSQRARAAVEQAQLLARGRPPHGDATLDLVQVEGMRGMAHAEQHKVGRVDRV